MSRKLYTLFLLLTLCRLTASAWSAVYLRTNALSGCSWANTSSYAFTQGADPNHWTLTISAPSTADMYFRLYVANDGGKEIYPSTDGAEPTAQGIAAQFGASSNNAFKIAAPVAGGSYLISAAYENNAWRVAVAQTSTGGTVTVEKGDYYVVFPTENVGNTRRYDSSVAINNHKAFRLTPSRVRNATPPSLADDLATLNMKVDGLGGEQLRYDAQGRIRFYIYNATTGESYAPADDDNFFTNHIRTAQNGVDQYDSRSLPTAVTTQPTAYYVIHKDLRSADKHSITIMFSRENANRHYNTTRVIQAGTHGNSVDGFLETNNIIAGILATRGPGSAYWNSYLSGKPVYLVGETNGTSYDRTASRPMQKLLYRGGTIAESECTDAQADSIVYRYDVARGTASWDNFFLSFAPEHNIGAEHTMWNRLLRPNVQDEMDGQALEGGVTFYKDNDGEDNTEQALNPMLSSEQKARYQSYTVYFNATYSTYRIEFHDGFYIAGPAVTGSYTKRKGMNRETFHGHECYTYRGEFKQGQRFAFFINDTSFPHNYREDAQAVTNTGVTDAWTVQAPQDGSDYQYHNHVTFSSDATDTEAEWTANEVRGVMFGLPDGEYTLRFYNHNETDGNSGLYTIDKRVELKNATSYYMHDDGNREREDYGGWRTFSDDCALWLPEGVKAYYVDRIDGGRAYLRELSSVPAHCGVLLSDENHKVELASETVDLSPIPGEHTATLTLADGEHNYLVDCALAATTVSPEQDGRYNYFFNYRYKKMFEREKSDVPLNFWKTFVGSTAKKNYTYLSVSEALPATVYNWGMYSDEPEPATNAARAYCMRLTFSDDDETATGINNPVTGGVGITTYDAWHTLQGQRIARPTAPGLYIHNGCKVIIR